MCGGESGTTYGIYMQLPLAALLYLTLRLMKILWHTPGNSYQLMYLQKMGFWQPGCLSIVMQRISSFLSLTLMELPILIIAAFVLTLSKEFFCLWVIAAAIIV